MHSLSLNDSTAAGTSVAMCASHHITLPLPCPGIACRPFSSLAARTPPIVPRSALKASSSGLVPSIVLPAPGAPVSGFQPVRWISVKRRRVVKMNKHKYEKLKKRMRRLTAKNLKGNA